MSRDNVFCRELLPNTMEGAMVTVSNVRALGTGASCGNNIMLWLLLADTEVLIGHTGQVDDEFDLPGSDAWKA